ncbi:hypothetical protein J7F01_16750 [Streptomyces sp. ISL-22]|uniref:hypothetical protein n=1 Tax=unclassified Streptomyces TaxID=2593676 RepID=UPI001BE7C6AF|nr:MULTISPECIES: hypothetical protein [unclassified Streptomyces]MBT2424095.1 hypothetical protein [Streptomyces sp. ISL-24]MBT2433799.1 hypothetical protein [Streptomyces sp. ISL-22]
MATTICGTPGSTRTAGTPGSPASSSPPPRPPADAAVHDAIKRVLDDKRRRERETRGPECGGSKPDKGQALSRDLVQLRDQAVACMNRYPRAVTFNEVQQAACEEALGTLEVRATWIRVKVGDHKSAAGRERAKARDLVAV